MTVAIAMLGAQAQAMAPTITDIPSPIVANDIPVTGGGTYGNFVYLDAMDLDTLASDDVTPSSDLMWTYTGSKDATGASNYRINGVSPMLGAFDPTSPTTAMIINRNDDPVQGKDAKKSTITIRNNVLSPLSGSGGSIPTTTGIVPTYTEPVTFFCSDGNAFSSQTVFFYTDKGGSDRLSGGDAFKPVDPAKPVDKITKFWRATEWNALKDFGKAFNLTTSTYGTTGQGICLKAGLTGYNWGALVSAYPYFNLASNQVYRIKMKMMGSQTTTGKTPFWDFILENYDDLPANAGTLNMYIFAAKFYDVEGGATALTTAGKTVTMYWAPPAVATAKWNDSASGAFVSSRDKINDPRLRFRTNDCDGVGSGDLRSGDMCITEIEVASAGLSRLQTVGSPLVNITKFTQSVKGGAAGNVTYTPLMGSTATFNSDGSVTITPTGAGQGANVGEGELSTFGPSTDGNYDADPAKSYNYDEYPITWKSDQLLRVQADLSAPTATDVAHPWDAICFVMLSLSNELAYESYITSNQGCGAPQTGTPQTYTTFLYTGTETKSTVAGYHKLRWEMRFVNSPSCPFPTGAEKANTGSVKVSRVVIQEVTFK
jgi:hypothetical protein